MADELEGMVEASLEEIEQMHRNQEEREQRGERGPARESWENIVPLITAFLAVLGTVAALMAAFSADRSLEAQMREIINRSTHHHALTQLEVLKSREEMLAVQGGRLPAADQKRLADLRSREPAFDRQYQDLKRESGEFRHAHHILAVAITVFQVSIALSATALIARRRWIWIAGMIAMAFGLAVCVWGGIDFFQLG